jgi:RNA polymerase sigma factor (sigma-70 family)
VDAGWGDRAAAEDLLQLALERAYRHWGRVCRSGDPERYVRRILANAAKGRWRRAVRRPEWPLGPGDASPVAGDQAHAVAEPDLLIRALAALPPRQRTVVVLRYYIDLSEVEIADVLGCSLWEVKARPRGGWPGCARSLDPRPGGPARPPSE